jgi:hypothetical protein
VVQGVHTRQCHARPHPSRVRTSGLQRVLQLIEEGAQRGADCHVVLRDPGSPNRRDDSVASSVPNSDFISAADRRGREGEHLRGERGHPAAAKGIVHSSQVVPRIVTCDLCPELIYRASNARTADERTITRMRRQLARRARTSRHCVTPAPLCCQPWVRRFSQVCSSEAVEARRSVVAAGPGVADPKCR